MEFFKPSKKVAPKLPEIAGNALSEAIQAGDLAGVKKLINAGVEIKTPRFDYRREAELKHHQSNFSPKTAEVCAFLEATQHARLEAKKAMATSTPNPTIHILPKSPRAGR